MVDLRPYQTEACNAILDEWSGGHRKTLLVLPTGCGKTIVFSSVIDSNFRRKGGKALILAHRSELLSQAADKLHNVCGLSCALEKADSCALDSLLPVTLGSVQTLSNPRRLERYPRDHFSTLVVDEAHHSMSDSYQRILNHFDADVLGVTATPDRADRKELSSFYDSLAYEYKLADAVREKYLCPVQAQLIPLQMDIDSIRISNGDYALSDIDAVLGPSLERIADEMVPYMENRKTLVFLPLVSTSKKFRDILRIRGLNAEEVNGESEDRERILSSFENGAIDILCNSMLLTEGWDCPSVDCIVVLRPTKVRSLYQQMVGRGMRLCDGKENLLLLDFLWLSEKHDLCKPSSLFSPDKKISEKVERAIASGNPTDLMEAEEQAEKDVVAEREAALAQQLKLLRTRKKRLVDPLQFAVSLDDESLMSYVPTFAWEMGPATEKQIQFLENCGIDAETVMNKGHASMIIGRIRGRMDRGLSTPKQINCLERYGFTRVGTWTSVQATSMISRISSNRWRLPCGINPASYILGGLG